MVAALMHKRYVDEALAWFRRWKLHAPTGAVEDLARIFERAESCGDDEISEEA